MVVGNLRGCGVPVALVGLRTHLFRRAMERVERQFGAERVAARASEARRLALSLLCGAFHNPSEGVAEKLIVTYFGGSRTHEDAEADDEDGSLLAGTVGVWEGEAGSFSVRLAYSRWARGLALCLGEVLRAGLPREGDGGILGPELDFGVEAALSKMPHNLPTEKLRSICRYMTSQLTTKTNAYRAVPGASLLDVAGIVEHVAGPVFKSRFADHRFELKAAECASMLDKRIKALESARTSSLRSRDPVHRQKDAAWADGEPPRGGRTRRLASGRPRAELACAPVGSAQSRDREGKLPDKPSRPPAPAIRELTEACACASWPA